MHACSDTARWANADHDSCGIEYDDDDADNNENDIGPARHHTHDRRPAREEQGRERPTPDAAGCESHFNDCVIAWLAERALAMEYTLCIWTWNYGTGTWAEAARVTAVRPPYAAVSPAAARWIVTWHSQAFAALGVCRFVAHGNHSPLIQWDALRSLLLGALISPTVVVTVRGPARAETPSHTLCVADGWLSRECRRWAVHPVGAPTALSLYLVTQTDALAKAAHLTPYATIAHRMAYMARAACAFDPIPPRSSPTLPASVAGARSARPPPAMPTPNTLATPPPWPSYLLTMPAPFGWPLPPSPPAAAETMPHLRIAAPTPLPKTSGVPATLSMPVVLPFRIPLSPAHHHHRGVQPVPS